MKSLTLPDMAKIRLPEPTMNTKSVSALMIGTNNAERYRAMLWRTGSKLRRN
jgi:hypothetical protein